MEGLNIRRKIMTDWSDYFEQFPEKNPANWVNGQYEPKLAAKLFNDKHKNDVSHSEENADLDDIIKKIKQETKAHSLQLVEDYPRNDVKKLKIKHMNYFTYLHDKIVEYVAMAMLILKH